MSSEQAKTVQRIMRLSRIYVRLITRCTIFVCPLYRTCYW